MSYLLSRAIRTELKQETTAPYIPPANEVHEVTDTKTLSLMRKVEEISQKYCDLLEVAKINGWKR